MHIIIKVRQNTCLNIRRYYSVVVTNVRSYLTCADRIDMKPLKHQKLVRLFQQVTFYDGSKFIIITHPECQASLSGFMLRLVLQMLFTVSLIHKPTCGIASSCFVGNVETVSHLTPTAVYSSFENTRVTHIIYIYIFITAPAFGKLKIVNRNF